MGIQYADIDDAVLLTQQNLVKRGAFLDLQTDLQDHVAVREMWKKRVKTFEGGDDWEWEAQVDHNHSAQFVKMYQTDGSALVDTMIRGRVQPRHVNAHYDYDKREKAFQRGGVAIVNYIKTKYVGMMVSFYELLEEALWGTPTDSSDDTTPFGIRYWLLRNATEGFNGENPSGFSSGRGNIDSTTYTRWANWSNDYVDVSKEDLLASMRRGLRKTKFRSPVSHAVPKLSGMGNGIYTNDSVLGSMETLLEQQNMNLGNDLASKDGRAMVKGTSVTYVPYLDADAANPVYSLDWKWLMIGVLAGWQNNLTKPYQVSDKHLVSRVDLDGTLQMICTNLRRQAVYYVA
jgi:hypothetical protein